jgi:hypothetical protein
MCFLIYLFRSYPSVRSVRVLPGGIRWCRTVQAGVISGVGHNP